MSTDLVCSQCGGVIDRPGLYGCTDPRHPAPTVAQRIVAAIERDFSDRRGLRQAWGRIDDDLMVVIRDEWARLIQAELDKDTP